MSDEPGSPRSAEAKDTALPALYHFAYCSRAADGVGDEEVSRIVELAQRRNLARGITGMLVFESGVFFQWIEGPPSEMHRLIADLHSDARHYDIVSLSQSEERRDRLYPRWDMEKVEAEDIREVLQDALDSVEDPNSEAALHRILEHFASGSLATLGRA